MAKQDLFTTVKAAELLHMTSRRVIGLCQEGKLPGAFRNGKSWQIPRTSVLAYLQDRRVKSPIDEKRRKHCAVGTTSFPELVRDCYYVDKTLLIKELLDEHSKVTLFTRPRRFGKTVNINMLKTFFELSDTDTSVYFESTKIWSCGETYHLQQGSYPVIFFTMKDIKYGSWDEALESLRLMIRDEYLRHDYLKGSDFLSGAQKDYFKRMEECRLTDVEYTRSLQMLSAMLEIHHKTRAIILIDEYDTPIQESYAKGYYKEMISFMRTFLSSGLKDNDSLEFGVLTGITRIAKENLFSGLNHLEVNTVLDDRYSNYFGFTEDEVLNMAQYYGREDSINVLQEWYDGYRFGNTEVYNPWSVSNFFSQGCVAKPYWSNTSDNEIIREILTAMKPELAEDLESLLSGKEVLVSLNLEVIYPRMTDDFNTIYSFLLLTGYLSPASAAQETDYGTFVTLRLPNKEVRRAYNEEILYWMRNTTPSHVISDFSKAVYLQDGNRLQKVLEAYFCSTISYYDGQSESFYHGILLGLSACLSSQYRIQSNREAGEGRYDIQLEPKRTGTLPGILMEFKLADSEKPEQLEKAAVKALQQIAKNHYEQDLHDRGITQIVSYGIAFYGKHTAVRQKTTTDNGNDLQ